VHFLPSGYRNAATTVRDLIESQVALGDAGLLLASSLVPPYLYLWRHYFEIRMKDLLSRAAQVVGTNRSMLEQGYGADDIVWECRTGRVLPSSFRKGWQRSHSLLRLWNELKPIVDWAIEMSAADADRRIAMGFPASQAAKRQITKAEVGIVSDLVTQLNNIDPDGQGARYSRDTSGAVTLKGIESIDLEHTQFNMERIAKILALVARHLSGFVRPGTSRPPLPSQSAFILLDDGRSVLAPSRGVSPGRPVAVKPRSSSSPALESPTLGGTKDTTAEPS
jgi:hypothetical protein